VSAAPVAEKAELQTRDPLAMGRGINIFQGTQDGAIRFFGLVSVSTELYLALGGYQGAVAQNFFRHAAQSVRVNLASSSATSFLAGGSIWEGLMGATSATGNPMEGVFGGQITFNTFQPPTQQQISDVVDHLAAYFAEKGIMVSIIAVNRALDIGSPVHRNSKRQEALSSPVCATPIDIRDSIVEETPSVPDTFVDC
jgi:hypothetical protein